jgi:hypothetical protein|tara:strand:- start:33 stop:284 length:252 start_codon:yes stop_codon:yes gene_type:complete
MYLGQIDIIDIDTPYELPEEFKGKKPLSKEELEALGVREVPKRVDKPEDTGEQIQKAGFNKLGKYASYVGVGALLYFAFLRKK